MRVLPVEATFSAASRMSCGATNCPFLMLTIAAGAARLQQQVGLPAQERRNLQDVGDFRRGPGLRGFVDVGQNRVALLLQARQDPQPLLQPGTAVGWTRCCGWLCRRTP